MEKQEKSRFIGLDLIRALAIFSAIGAMIKST